MWKTSFFYELNMCLDQTSSDVNGDCGGTHNINDICMKIWKATYLKGDVDEIDELS